MPPIFEQLKNFETNVHACYIAHTSPMSVRVRKRNNWVSQLQELVERLHAQAKPLCKMHKQNPQAVARTKEARKMHMQIHKKNAHSKCPTKTSKKKKKRQLVEPLSSSVGHVSLPQVIVVSLRRRCPALRRLLQRLIGDKSLAVLPTRSPPRAQPPPNTRHVVKPPKIFVIIVGCRHVDTVVSGIAPAPARLPRVADDGCRFTPAVHCTMCA